MKKIVFIFSISCFSLLANAQENSKTQQENFVCKNETGKKIGAESLDSCLNTDNKSIETKKMFRKRRILKNMFSNCQGVDLRNAWGLVSMN